MDRQGERGIGVKPDDIEPIGRAIGRLLAGTPGLYRWDGYTDKEDLIPLRQTADDEIQFVRERDGKARLAFYGIKGNDLVDIKFGKPVVMSSEKKGTAKVRVDARKYDNKQSYEWSKTFADGKSEFKAITAGFEVSSKSTFGTGSTAPVKGEQSLELKVKSEWKNQTGHDEKVTKGGKFSLTADPGTLVEGYLTWDEQDIRQRITGFGTFDCAVHIGKRAKGHKKWHWTGDYHWGSLGELIATAEGNGSVKYPLRDHFMAHPAPAHLLDPIRAMPRRPYTQLLEYPGTDNIEVVPVTVENVNK